MSAGMAPDFLNQNTGATSAQFMLNNPERTPTLVATMVANSANWGGSTLKLQGSPDGGTTWIDVASATLSANGMVNVLYMFPLYRWTITAGTGTGISAWLF